MAIQTSDLLYVQRGSTPLKTTAGSLSSYVNNNITIGSGGNVPIASASQLGVIRVGSGLLIDSSTGILTASVGGGITYEGVWTDPNNPPTATASGQLWVYEGTTGVALNNPAWGSSNGLTINKDDRILYNSNNDWDLIPAPATVGVQSIVGIEPITVNSSNSNIPEISIISATTLSDGSMSAADKAKLDGIEAGAQVNVNQNLSYTSSSTTGTINITNGNNATIPAASDTVAGLMTVADKTKLDSLSGGGGGTITAIQEGDAITVDNTNTAIPKVSVSFGSTTSTPTTAMPFNVSLLNDLP